MERFGTLNSNSLVDKSTNGNESGQRKIHRRFWAIGSQFKREQRKLGLGGKCEITEARKVYLNPCNSWATLSLYKQGNDWREKIFLAMHTMPKLFPDWGQFFFIYHSLMHI